MSYAEAKAEAEASLSRSDSVAGFGVFVMFFPRFDDRIPALPRPPPQSLHSPPPPPHPPMLLTFISNLSRGARYRLILRRREGSKKS